MRGIWKSPKLTRESIQRLETFTLHHPYFKHLGEEERKRAIAAFFPLKVEAGMDGWVIECVYLFNM